jgi:hypothetical protein
MSDIMSTICVGILKHFLAVQKAISVKYIYIYIFVFIRNRMLHTGIKFAISVVVMKLRMK